MKTIFTLLSVFLISSSLRAQNAQEALPAPAAPGTPLSNPGTLIPEPPPLEPKPSTATANKPSAEESFRKSSTGIAVSSIEQKIRFRKAETAALQDPRFQEMKEYAFAAKTEKEKRARMKDYYTLLFDRVAKIDKSLKGDAEAKKQGVLARFDQTNVRGLGEDRSLFDLSE